MISIRKVAKDICDLMDDTNYSKEDSVLKSLSNGYAELIKYNVIPSNASISIKSQIRQVGENYTWDCPPDFMYYTKVGVCVNGRVENIILDETLCSPEPDYCETDPPSTDEFIFHNVYYGNAYLGEWYGLSASISRHGYFKYEPSNQRLVFKDIDPAAEIIVEYKSNDDLGHALINPQAQNALKAYYYWDKAQAKGTGDQELRFRQWNREKDALKLVTNRMTKSEWEQAILRNVVSTVKR